MTKVLNTQNIFEEANVDLPPKEFKPKTPKELGEEAADQVKTFSTLLDSIKSLDTNKKVLWRQIYENAVNDRRNAYLMFSDLYFGVHGNIDQHAIHGLTLAKYCERMEKSNGQLLHLAELVERAQENEQDTGKQEDSLYDTIKVKTAKKS